VSSNARHPVALAPVVAVVALVLAGAVACTADVADPGFVADVRNAYPELSVRDVPDDELVELGKATCSPSGLDDDQRDRLGGLGIDPSEFARLSLPLCPSR
jgi:hypothetical protein